VELNKISKPTKTSLFYAENADRKFLRLVGNYIQKCTVPHQSEEFSSKPGKLSVKEPVKGKR
jgi:hypothetical protein